MAFHDIEHTGSGQDHEGHHIIPASVYFQTFGILMVLLVITVAVSYVDMPRWLGVLVAMAIAIVKATFVVANFMGVKFQSKLTWMWAAAGFIWLLILFLTVFDYITRDWISVYGW